MRNALEKGCLESDVEVKSITNKNITVSRREWIRMMVFGALGSLLGCKGSQERKEAANISEFDDVSDKDSFEVAVVETEGQPQKEFLNDNLIEILNGVPEDKLIFECFDELGMGYRDSDEQVFEDQNKGVDSFRITRSAKITRRANRVREGEKSLMVYRVQTGYKGVGEDAIPCFIISEYIGEKGADGKTRKKTHFTSFEVHGFGNEPSFAKVTYAFPKRRGKSLVGRLKTFKRDDETGEWKDTNPSKRKRRQLTDEQIEYIPDRIENEYFEVLEVLEEACLSWKKRKGLE